MSSPISITRANPITTTTTSSLDTIGYLQMRVQGIHLRMFPQEDPQCPTALATFPLPRRHQRQCLPTGSAFLHLTNLWCLSQRDIRQCETLCILIPRRRRAPLDSPPRLRRPQVAPTLLTSPFSLSSLMIWPMWRPPHQWLPLILRSRPLRLRPLLLLLCERPEKSHQPAWLELALESRLARLQTIQNLLQSIARSTSK